MSMYFSLFYLQYLDQKSLGTCWEEKTLHYSQIPDDTEKETEEI